MSIERTKWSVAIVLLAACASDGMPDGTRVGVDAGMDMATVDAGVADAGAMDASAVDAGTDGGADAGSGGAGPEDAGVGCDFGTASSAASATMESLFGARVPFADDAALPAGTYEIAYVDGCFKYASDQGWTIHARDNGGFSWHLVGAEASPMDPQLLLPGTVGIRAGEGAFESFDDCVAANAAIPPILYEHAGGPLGIWLADSNYPDNVVGEDGRNPAWSLTGLDCAE